ncbi:MAG: hypothetical protein WC459_03070 [Patescibacteria group bacterium]
MAKTIEIKLNKRVIINILLAIAVLAVILEAAELGLIAYALKAGTLCK